MEDTGARPGLTVAHPVLMVARSVPMVVLPGPTVAHPGPTVARPGPTVVITRASGILTTIMVVARDMGGPVMGGPVMGDRDITAVVRVGPVVGRAGLAGGPGGMVGAGAVCGTRKLVLM